MRSTLKVRHRALCLQIVTISLLATVFISSNTEASVAPTVINPNGQGAILVVGDSLSVGTDAFGSLQSRIEKTGIWSLVVIDDRVGRTAKQSIPILQKRINKDTTAVVVALATNDLLSRSEPSYPQSIINQVMGNSKNLPVLWVNIKYSATGRRDWVARSQRFNRALATAQSRWPQLYIADWNKGFVPKQKSRFIADGIHLTVSGYKTRATFLVNQLEQFGNTIVDSSTTTTSTTSTSTSTTSTTVASTPAPTEPVS